MLNMNTLIATPSAQTCNFQIDFNTKKLKEEFNLFCCFWKSYEKAFWKYILQKSQLYWKNAEDT